MELLSVVNAVAAGTTVLAAILVASNYSAKVMVAGFIIYTVTSTAWIYSGLIDHKTSLIAQNAVLLVVSLFGIWRWAPKAS